MADDMADDIGDDIVDDWKPSLPTVKLLYQFRRPCIGGVTTWALVNH